MQVRPARPDDDPGLRRLLRETPMAGAISLAFAREPSFFHAAAVEGDTATFVAEAPNGRIVAAFSRSVRPCWVSGRPTPLGYLSALRIAPEHRGRRRLLQDGFARVRELQDADRGPPWSITTIVSDNAPARRLLEAGLPGLPTYRFADELVTLAATPRWRALGRAVPGLEVRQARPEDLGELVAVWARFGARHAFGPVWDAATVTDPVRCRGLSVGDVTVATRGGQVVGCVATWDQSAFKQTIVAGYSGWLGRVRPLVDALGRVVGTARLPPPGGELRHVSLSHLAIDGDDPEVAAAVVAAAHDRLRASRVAYLTTMLAASHPLLPVLRRLLRPREYRSRLYGVGWAGFAGWPSARPHLEVAVM